MIDIDSSILLQAANFLLMWFILNQLLFKPVRGIIKKRGEVMAGQLEAINGFTSDAAKKVADYEAALTKARAAEGSGSGRGTGAARRRPAGGFGQAWRRP